MSYRRNSFLVGKAFKQYLLATVLTVAATQMASLVDASLVGQLISIEALGAVNLSKPILQFSFSIGNLFIIGGSLLTGVAIGVGDRDKANRIFSTCLVTIVIAGIVILACGQIWFDSFLSFFCNSEVLREMAGKYMRITFITMLPFLLSYMLETFVIVDGSPKLATIAVVVSNIMNIVLDIVFIKYCGWGIQGAAIATCIMYVVSALILLAHFIKKNDKVKRIRLDFHREPGIIGPVIKNSLPITITTFLIAVQIAVCNRISIDYIGEKGVIAFAVCIALLGFSMIFISGVMRTVQPVGAILKGMGDSRGVLLVMRRAYRFLTICLMIFTTIMLLAPNAVAGIFGVKDTAMMPYISRVIASFSIYILLEGLVSLLIPVYQFYDHNNLSMFVALGKTAFPILLFWIMAVFVPEYAWWGFALSQIVVAALLLPFIVIARKKDESLSKILLIPLQSESEVFDITIPSDIHSLNNATDGVRLFLSNNAMSSQVSNYSALCCEELVKNIVEHSNAHFIDVKAQICGPKACISIHDDGRAFNPLKITDKDKIGLTIVRNISSEIKYDYIFNQNMITIELIVNDLST